MKVSNLIGLILLGLFVGCSTTTTKHNELSPQSTLERTEQALSLLEKDIEKNSLALIELNRHLRNTQVASRRKQLPSPVSSSRFQDMFLKLRSIEMKLSEISLDEDEDQAKAQELQARIRHCFLGLRKMMKITYFNKSLLKETPQELPTI